MTDIDIPDGWREIPPEGFDTRTFVTDVEHEFFGPAAHVAYYEDKHTVEVCVSGTYDFHYHDTETDAFDRIETAMDEALDELEGNDD